MLHRPNRRLDHPGVFLADRCAERAASFAGTKSGTERVRRRVEERNVLAFRGAGRAAWPAEDAGRVHGEHEFALISAVPIDDGAPSLLVKRRGGWGSG